MVDDVTFADICAAQRRIQPFVRQTPFEESPLLAVETGAERVRLKREDQQHLRSFKPRGMTNAVLDYPAGSRISIGSSGSAGIAVTNVARMQKIRTCVVAPKYITPQKAHVILSHDASLRRQGDVHEESAEVAQSMKKHGWVPLDADEDGRVIAGHGTMVLEMFDESDFPDVIIVPVGGGALLAGVALAAKTINPGTRVIGVQSEASQPWYPSIHAGRIVSVSYGESIAEGLIGGISPLCFDIAKSFLSKEDIVVVKESSIASAMRWFFNEHGAIIEGTSAVVLAALLTGKINVKGKNVAAIITGGNIDPLEFAEIIS
jgi:threonine dehydratase